MNKRQKLFAKEYIIDLNATQAATRAGYSEKTAYSLGQRLLKNVEVQDYIQKLMDKRSNKIEITAENILNDILDTRQTCKDNMLSDTEFGVKLDSAAVNGRNKANELIGKHLKLFTDKVESVNTNHNLNNDVSGMTEAELDEIIKNRK